MDFLLANWLLILTVLVSGAMLLAPALAGGSAAAVTPAQAVQLMNREKAVLIDVREAAEYSAGFIKGARHLPLAELPAKLEETCKNKNLPLVLYCASGVRSGRAAALARRMGYAQAFSLTGGIKAWSEAGLPVSKG